ncbi:MAG: phosphonate metabolism transcriptional regulator PhnF [Pseudomonadota bacterium]
MAASSDWQVVYNTICSHIREGQFVVGDKLPSQSEMAQQFGVNRHAIRRALEKLREDGSVASWQGKGTIVAPTPIVYKIYERTRLATHLRQQGHDVQVRAMKTSQNKRLNSKVARMLDLKMRDRVAFGEFMHHVDGLPTAIGRHFFNSARFPTILDQLGEEPSVPEAFRRLGVETYYRSSTLIEVRPATPYEALALEIPAKQSVFGLWGRNVDKEDRPIEVTEAVVRADLVQLEVTTSTKSGTWCETFATNENWN